MAGGRGIKSRPACVAIFICMAIKAVHLELVTDYSTAAFLVAFTLFYPRRGILACVYSDRGTNFQEASRELSLTFTAVCSDEQFRSGFMSDQIKWSARNHFVKAKLCFCEVTVCLPPSSLWDA